MQHRRISLDEPPRSAGGPIVTVLLAGAAIGLAAGFLLGEALGGQGRRTLSKLWPTRRSPRPQVAADLAQSIRTALEREPRLRDQPIEVLPAGRRALELHGWVSSRADRARAIAAATRAAGSTARVVDCLLVRGEDDLTPPDLEVAEEPQSA